MTLSMLCQNMQILFQNINLVNAVNSLICVKPPSFLYSGVRSVLRVHENERKTRVHSEAQAALTISPSPPD